MIKTRPCGRNKPLFRTCKQSQPVQSHEKTTLGVNEKIQSDIADTIASLGVNGPLSGKIGFAPTTARQLYKWYEFQLREPLQLKFVMTFNLEQISGMLLMDARTCIQMEKNLS